MDIERLSDAIGEINGAYVEEANQQRQKRNKRTIHRVIVAAAALAAAVAGVIVLPKLIPQKTDPNNPSAGVVIETVSETPGTNAPDEQPRDMHYELIGPHYPEIGTSLLDWENTKEEQYGYKKSDAYSDGVRFTAETLPLFLGNNDENAAYSPFGIYMSLACLAEISAGNTREQILQLLGADSVEALRATVKAMWLNAYCSGKKYGMENESSQICIPANSFWLNGDYNVKGDASAAQILKDNYYMSFFKGSAADEAFQNAYRNWLDQSTGGLLKDAVRKMSISPTDVFSMVNTIYLNASWYEEFNEDENTTEPFFGTMGETDAEYMHKAFFFTPCWQNDDFSAFRIYTQANASVLFILPGKGLSVSELIKNGVYEKMLSILNDPNAEPAPPEGYDGYQVNLSLPKFDLTGSYDLKEKLISLGVTDAFDAAAANIPFIEGVNGEKVCVTGAKQDTRLQINEKGISAAAITAMSGGWGSPVFYEIELNLNRPFLVLVLSECNTPLFAAAVNNIPE